MPKIPDFTDVGQTVPTPSYRRPFMDRSGEMIAEGAESLGRDVAQVQQQDQQRAGMLARGEADNALLDHQLAVRGAVADIQQKVQSGELRFDQAGQAYQDAVGKLPAPSIPNLDDVSQMSLDRGMQRNLSGGAQEVLGIARVGQKQAFADQFGGALDKLSKLAGMPGADIDALNSNADTYRPMGLAAGFSAADLDKRIQSFRDQNWFNQATQRAIEAKDNLPALKSLDNDLTSGDGFYAGRLPVDKRNAILRTVQSDQIILQNRMEHEQDRRESLAATTMGRVDEQISSGIPATPTMWDTWGAQVKGTRMEDAFNDAQDHEAEVQRVLRMPIADQVKYVDDKQAQLESQGGTLRDAADLMRMRTAITQNTNLMQTNPLVYNANRTGQELQAMDFSKVGTQDGDAQVGATIADRMSTLASMRKQYGAQVGQQPLLPQEAADLSARLDQATPQDKVSILTGLRNAFNNDDAYQAAMRRIAPGSPVTAIAGQMIGAQAPAATPAWYERGYAPQPSDVATILQGETLLNPRSGGKDAAAAAAQGVGAVKGGMPMPDDKALRVTFGQGATGLFDGRPQLADAYYGVFKDAYAGLLAQRGDYRGVGDSTTEQQALRIALGNRVNFNGSAVSAPAGMDPTRFSGLVRAAVAQGAKASNASQDWVDGIQGYGLQELGGLGSGVYRLTMGNQPIQAPSGKGDFVVDLHKQYLPGTAGAAIAENPPPEPYDGPQAGAGGAGALGK